MTRAPLLLAALLGGCLVVPTSKTTYSTAGTHTGRGTLVRSGAVELAAAARDEWIAVHASRRGECRRQISSVVLATRERKAKLASASDPRGAVFGALLAPVTLPVSLLVTGVVVGLDAGSTTEELRPLRVETYACRSEAAGVPVTMTLPSGETVHSITDEDGEARFRIPPAQPRIGQVTLAAAGASPAQVSYALPRPATAVAEDAVRACATAHGVRGAIEAKLSINDSGRATRLWMSAGTHDVIACVGKQVAGVRFPSELHAQTLRVPLDI